MQIDDPNESQDETPDLGQEAFDASLASKSDDQVRAEAKTLAANYLASDD